MNRDSTQWRVKPSRLGTGSLHSREQEEGTPSYESSIFHFHDEKSEHEHGDTSTSEDDVLKLLNLPGLASTRERKPIVPRHPRDRCGRMLLRD